MRGKKELHREKESVRERSGVIHFTRAPKDKTHGDKEITPHTHVCFRPFLENHFHRGLIKRWKVLRLILIVTIKVCQKMTNKRGNPKPIDPRTSTLEHPSSRNQVIHESHGFPARPWNVKLTRTSILQYFINTLVFVLLFRKACAFLSLPIVDSLALQDTKQVMWSSWFIFLITSLFLSHQQQDQVSVRRRWLNLRAAETEEHEWVRLPPASLPFLVSCDLRNSPSVRASAHFLLFKQ